MKSLITAFLLIVSVSLSYSETGQELQLKGSSDDGPSLEDTIKWLKDNISAMKSFTLTDGIYREKQFTYNNFKFINDKCLITISYDVKPSDYNENNIIEHYSTTCDMAKVRYSTLLVDRITYTSPISEISLYGDDRATCRINNDKTELEWREGGFFSAGTFIRKLVKENDITSGRYVISINNNESSLKTQKALNNLFNKCNSYGAKRDKDLF